ncbi:zf-HC2 domain-containing protein [Brevibacillus gelatini]|uniref:Anti-sigma-W factor RsiW n=1 Tax=Brevibacillus gelatini TaxID=1655277 RepID=A0A3M8B9C8_9BACL|nr:zf-HC2 domain-containing protein [Brevibacillus gelatini]RNB60044.1 zf-HC2 domain-containing protein [Brevibacillus gelatini]
MKCADTGLMQTFLDGECDAQESAQLRAHLEECGQCQALLEELKALDDWSREKIEAHVFAQADQVKVDTEAAWQRFSQTVGKTKKSELHDWQSHGQHRAKRSWQEMNKSTKRWMTAASAAAVVAVSLSFPQVQAAASDFLSIFRMNKVEFVKVTPEDLQQVESWIANGNVGEMDLQGIGKIWIDGMEEGKQDKRNQYYNSREAAEKAGVKLPELPDELAVDGVEVTSPYRVHLEINTERANKLLAQLQVEAKFDEKLNGQRITLEIPKMQKTWIATGNDSYSYAVVDAPELKAPEGVDLGQLRETMLALPFIPDQVKKQMLAIEDWKHTIPVPYMADGKSDRKEVKVNGADGMLLTGKYETHLVWQQDGKIHMLDGSEKSGEALLALAKKLK